ncbi:MAG: hypothetical protein ACXWMF_11870 [Syntrophales bacterium]
MTLRTRKSAARMSSEEDRVSLTMNGEACELETGKVFAKHASIVLK